MNRLLSLVGSLLIIAMLCLLFYIGRDTTPQAPSTASTGAATPMTSDEKAMKSLKIE